MIDTRVIFRHYKMGAEYRILHFATEEDSGDVLVVYQAVVDDGPPAPIWVRPAEDFFARVPGREDEGGMSVRRFEPDYNTVEGQL